MWREIGRGELNKKSYVVQETIWIEGMAVAMATWKLIISIIYRIDEHLDVVSETEGENRDDFKDG